MRKGGEKKEITEGFVCGAGMEFLDRERQGERVHTPNPGKRARGKMGLGFPSLLSSSGKGKGGGEGEGKPWRIKNRVVIMRFWGTC